MRRPGDLIRLSWSSKQFRKRFTRSLQQPRPFAEPRGPVVFGGGALADHAEHAAKYADIYAEMDRKVHEPEMWNEGPPRVRWRRTAARWQRWSQLDGAWIDDDDPPGALLEHLETAPHDNGTWQLADGTWIPDGEVEPGS